MKLKELMDVCHGSFIIYRGTKIFDKEKGEKITRTKRYKALADEEVEFISVLSNKVIYVGLRW